MKSDYNGSLKPSNVNKANANKRQKLSSGQENLMVVGKVSSVKPSSLQDDDVDNT